MKNIKKQRRIQIIIVAFVALGLSTGLMWYATRDAFQFFRSPSEVIGAPPSSKEIFRIGGLVVANTIERRQGTKIQFQVTDGGASVPVSYEGILPDLFAENQGIVALGRYVDGVFVADEILAKHDETYMPAEVLDALKEQGMYQPTR